LRRTCFIAIFLLPLPAFAAEGVGYDGVLEELQRKEEIVFRQIAGLKKEAKKVEEEIKETLAKRMVAASQRDQKRVADLDRELADLLSGKEEISKAEQMLESLRKDREVLLAFSRASEAALLKKSIVAAKPYLDEQIRRLPGVDILTWPVEPSRGLSARFRDEGYAEQFGIPHYAVDIPTKQGSPIKAPRDGVVLAVNDAGYGYSTIELQHGSNLRTLYGHVSRILVKEGQIVRQGSVIGLTGGRPGSHGAGFLTTGPHLHFEVSAGGRKIDPLTLLPRTYDLTYRPLSAVGGGN
jgi:murein DD-endopeptidase MepM/ murein hydrolase activator NlpD